MTGILRRLGVDGCLTHALHLPMSISEAGNAQVKLTAHGGIGNEFAEAVVSIAMPASTADPIIVRLIVRWASMVLVAGV